MYLFQSDIESHLFKFLERVPHFWGGGRKKHVIFSASAPRSRRKKLSSLCTFSAQVKAVAPHKPRRSPRATLVRRALAPRTRRDRPTDPMRKEK